MIRSIPAFALVLAAAPALAEQNSSPAPPPEPAQAALAQMVQECQGREAGALVRVYTLQAQLAAEKKRADEAEAKLKAAEKPAEPAK